MFTPHFDLGIKQLYKDWRQMFTTQYLTDDLLAGAVVACVALPLSLAIALASGVGPEVGIVTAIIAGIVCALFGGVPLAVSGPAAAMAVLVAAVVQDYGFSSLLFIGFGCGILQLLTGIIGIGAVIRFIPVPVVMGFTAGIGAIILIGQFPRILGLPAPPESHVFSVILHIRDLFHQTQPAALLLALSTIAISVALPRIWPRLPSPLFAVLIPSLVAYLLHLNVEVVGSLPSSLPAPRFPTIPADGAKWLDIISTTFVVYALASLETLLSAGAVDQLSKAKPHDPNQELIGQGLGNIASAVFTGIPVTAVIARSALNVHAGAKTRRAAIFHSVFLLATVYFISPMMSQIPIAVLAGILVTIALRMCHPHEFLQLWHSGRSDAVIYLVTFIMIVILGLMAGIQVGIVAALLLAAIRLSQVKIELHTSQFGPAQLALDGPLTFLSVGKLSAYEKKVAEMDFPSGLIIDITRVKGLDSSGAKNLTDLMDQLKAKNVKFVLYGVDPEHLKIWKAANPEIDNYIADNEEQMEIILGLESQHQQLTMDRLIYGIEKFKKNLHPKDKAAFSSLAKTQKPHTLFITCSDSRIDPNRITSTQPGELFIVRNVGNIIPKFGEDDIPAEGAAVEYALGVLNVKQIIVCSHSGCGAIAEVLSGNIFSPESRKRFPSVARWLQEVKNFFPKDITSEQAAKLNASMQLDNLKTYPIVKEKLANKSVKLQALYYDIGNADVQMWDEVLGRYIVIGENTQPVVFGANQIRGLKLN
jgi:carbonic anhydrase